MEAAGSLTAYAVAFLADWAILRVALIPILGRLVWSAAVVFGLGALAVAIWWASQPLGLPRPPPQPPTHESGPPPGAAVKCGW